MADCSAMAMGVGNPKIDRLVVLLDINSIANRPIHLTLAIQQFVKTILYACTKDGPVLWSFKVFDSSIAPVSFKTQAEKLLGNRPTEVLFGLDDAASNFVKFGEVLKSIHGLKEENAYAPNVDFLVSAIQELLNDNTWEPLLDFCNRSEKKFPMEINSNILMLCSSFPKFQKQMNEFFNTTADQSLSKIVASNFHSLHRKFEEKNIRPFWVDTDIRGTKYYFDFAFQRRVSGVLQKIGWGIRSLDSLCLGSLFIPHSLVLSFISETRLQKPASVYGKLRLQVVDKKEAQRSFLICEVGLVYVDNSGHKCLSSQAFKSSRFLHNDAKLRITVIALLPKCFVASASHTLECYLMRQHPSDKLDGRDYDALMDRVLEQFQSNIGDFEIGKPVIHLVLSSIAREECVALLHVEIVSSNRTLNLSGILEPFSLSLGILRFAENFKELLDFSFLRQKLQSVSEYPENVRGKFASRHLASKDCIKQENQLYNLETTDCSTAWSSYIEFLELHDKSELNCPLLEEGYTSLTTKCMRVFKCWLHQEKEKLKSFIEGQIDDLIKVCQTLKFKEDAPTLGSKDKVNKVVLSVNEAQCRDHPRTRYSALCDSLVTGCSNYSIACSVADLQMPEDVRRLLKPFDRQKFGLFEGPIPALGEPFSYWGNRYVIKDSTIPGAGRGLFILNDVKVGYGTSVALMIYGGPEYNSSEFEKLAYYSFRMTVYGCNSNARSLELTGNYDPKCRLYIDGRPEEHGNIAGLINSCGSEKSLINCLFEERENDCEEYMKETCERFIMVMATRSLSRGDELLLDYDICTDVPPQFVT